jgi:hypothetical protein
MLNKPLRVRPSTDSVYGSLLANINAVIARQALAQEDVADFNNDFPETIPIDLKGNEGGCAC